jgi:hypothetical protein
MKREQQTLDLDPSMIILGLSYATLLLVAIGWVATL